MEKKRCQVCDGPVVNGRCKLCGMPYRNDETLYHLNENRSDHYRHATSRARAIMRQEEIPLGDKKAGSAAYKTGTGTGVAGAGNKYDQKTGTGSSKSLAGAGTGNFYNKGSVKAGSTYGGSTGAAKNGNKVSVPAGNYNSKSRQSTAGTYSTAAKKSSVYTQKPVKKKKGSLQTGLIYIILIVWALTTIYPILWVIMNSFKDKKHIMSDAFSLPFGDLFTLGNYAEAFEKVDILSAYRNSIIISGAVAVLVILMAGMASFALVRYRFRLNKTLYSLVIAAMMFPVFSTIIPVFRMEYGWGLAGSGNVWLSLISVILPQTAGNLAFAMVVLTGYMKGLPIELEEAAFMEGCNAYQIFFKVIMPLTKPSFATVGIFSFLWSYNDLFTQQFFLRNKEEWAITRLLLEISSREGTNYGLMAAVVTLVVVPLLIVYVCLQKYIIKGMTAGAVKG